ncbi:tryptophan-rich sensory protein [[Mycobacterium] wendilense]|uniref:Tryptophan-rich sensory protein n=1 Tax=[Mycobacterium] wendilense TaxID=3064284 RepID=A0ABN9P660_9MYCO|nr:tryptophan-rich sensory protein [Mycolicibacterium sp. MU0050]CAJ1585441.1 tryptophan-rich sensory protein [Mycolicibacterium sp. MU0050]
MSSPDASPGVQSRTGKGPLLAVAVVVATVAMLVVNGMANAMQINGQSTGDVTRGYEVYFIPAGYAFSIWSLIYVGLIAYTGYLGWSVFRGRDADTAVAIAPLYILTAVANASWLLSWHYNQFPLSMLVMVVLLVTLIVIYRMLAARPAASRLELWTVHIPFRVYLGWISVATIANATITLDDAGWNGFGISEPTWGVIMIVVATALGLVMSFMYADAAYVAVLVWALVAVAVRLSDTTSVFVAALAGAVVLAGVAVVNALRRRELPAKVTV